MTKKDDTKHVIDLLETLLIVELLKQGIAQLDIRKLIGGDIHRVSKIAKLIKNNKK